MSGSAEARVRRLTHRQGPNFSLGFRVLPVAKRRAVYAAYAVCRIADDIVDEAPPGAPAGETIGKLDAWQAEIEAAYAGRPHETATRALAGVLDRFPIPKRAFFELIEGCRWDLVKNRYETFAELERYCELVAVTISDISLAIFGTVDRRAPELGRDLAIALQLTNVCRDVGEDAGRDRIYLPQDELGRFDVDEEEILACNAGPAFRELMAFQVDRARSFFRRANPLPGCIAPDSRLAVRLMGRVYATILEHIGRSPDAVLHRRVRLGPASRAGVVLAGLLRRPFAR
ncbi:MAG: squalene/phytoene synthase family protein [Acidobacteria bacterium]|nr:squalene/phytoene synthase family protein [Acidobacteriota bacterium]